MRTSIKLIGKCWESNPVYLLHTAKMLKVTSEISNWQNDLKCNTIFERVLSGIAIKFKVEYYDKNVWRIKLLCFKQIHPVIAGHREELLVSIKMQITTFQL